MRAKRSEFICLRRSLSEVLTALRRNEREDLDRIERVWKQTAPELSSYTTVEGVRRGRLVIACKNSSAVAEGTQFYHDIFLERLREQGIGGISSVLFRLRGEP